MGEQSIETIISASAVYTSAIVVQAHQRVNASIRIGGSFVQDPTNSTFSGTLELQRRFAGTKGVWRGVESWTVVAADGLDGGKEYRTPEPEPETVEYRLGCTLYHAGNCYLRMGTGG